MVSASTTAPVQAENRAALACVLGLASLGGLGVMLHQVFEREVASPASIPHKVAPLEEAFNGAVALSPKESLEAFLKRVAVGDVVGAQNFVSRDFPMIQWSDFQRGLARGWKIEREVIKGAPDGPMLNLDKEILSSEMSSAQYLYEVITKTGKVFVLKIRVIRSSTGEEKTLIEELIDE